MVIFFTYILYYYTQFKSLFSSNQNILGMCVSLIREVTVLLQQSYWFLPPIRSSRRVRSRREKKQKTPGSKKKKKKNLLVSFWLLLLLWWWRQRCWKLPLALLCTSSVAWKFPLVCVPVAAAIAAAATDSAAGLRRGRWPYSARCHGHQCRVTAIALELRPLTPQGTIATTLVILFDENFDIQLFTNVAFILGFFIINII